MQSGVPILIAGRVTVNLEVTELLAVCRQLAQSRLRLPDSDYSILSEKRPLRSAALLLTDSIACFRKSKIDQRERKDISEQRDDAALGSHSSTSHPFRALERWIQQVAGDGDATVGDSEHEALSPIPRGVYANGKTTNCRYVAT